MCLTHVYFSTCYIACEASTNGDRICDVNIPLTAIVTVTNHYRSALCTTHVSIDLTAHTLNSLFTLIFPSSSYYHYIITVVKVSGVYQ